MSIADWTVSAVSLAAVVMDVRSGRIAWWLSSSAAALGLALAALGSTTTLTGSVAGLLVGLAIGAVCYATKGFGGGDAAMVAAVGALKGGWFAGYTLFYACSAAAIIAVLRLGWRGELVSTVAGTFRRGAAKQPMTMAFAPALAIGVAVTLYFEQRGGAGFSLLWW